MGLFSHKISFGQGLPATENTPESLTDGIWSSAMTILSVTISEDNCPDFLEEDLTRSHANGGYLIMESRFREGTAEMW